MVERRSIAVRDMASKGRPRHFFFWKIFMSDAVSADVNVAGVVVKRWWFAFTSTYARGTKYPNNTQFVIDSSVQRLCSNPIHHICCLAGPRFKVFALLSYQLPCCVSSACFQARSQNCDKRLLISRCLSFCPRAASRLSLGGFSWNLIFEHFSKFSRENSCCIRIRQE